MLRKHLLSALLLCSMLIVFQNSYSQNKEITGRVTDSKDGSGLSGATVSAKGSTTGTQTGADGSFRLSVPASATTLVFTSVGFITQEISIDGKSSISVSLAINNASLGEVIVV